MNGNTSVREYVGARYVPLFADPNEWSSQSSYEPLTIVIYQGNSYTSKQYVPVGIDIGNTDYWALTGNYNAQVEAYRAEVNKVSQEVNKVSQEVNKVSQEVNTVSQEVNTVSQEVTTLKGSLGEAAYRDVSNSIDSSSIGSNELPTANAVYEVTESFSRQFPTVADMIASTMNANGDLVSTLGYYAAGDGGASSYVIVDSVTPDMEYITLANGLYASLVFSDTANVVQFGAKSDDETIDAGAIINRMIEKGVHLIKIPFGNFYVNTSIVLPKGRIPCRIEGNVSVPQNSYTPTYSNRLIANTGDAPAISMLGSGKKQLRDITITSQIGSASTNSPNPSTIGVYLVPDSEAENLHNNAFENCQINLASVPSANGGNGSIAFYGVQAENCNMYNCTFRGDIPMVWSTKDEFSLFLSHGGANSSHNSSWSNSFINLMLLPWNKSKNALIYSGGNTDFINCYTQGRVKFSSGIDNNFPITNCTFNFKIEAINASMALIVDTNIAYCRFNCEAYEQEVGFYSENDNLIIGESYVNVNTGNHPFSRGVTFKQCIIVKSDNANISQTSELLCGNTIYHANETDIENLFNSAANTVNLFYKGNQLYANKIEIFFQSTSGISNPSEGAIAFSLSGISQYINNEWKAYTHA